MEKYTLIMNIAKYELIKTYSEKAKLEDILASCLEAPV